MPDVAKILIGKGEKPVFLDPRHANQHGLISGASGTGKSVTTQLLAEGFSRLGVPVFIADVKGDLSGLSQPGKTHPKVEERVSHIRIDNFTFDKNSCVLWDLYGVDGHPVKATVSDIGPILLSRLLGLNDKQERILTIAFQFADEEGLLLLDLKDLHTMLKFIADNAKQFRSEYGNISSASVGAIQRRLATLDDQGTGKIFGEPQLDLQDLMQVDSRGHGNINILSADKLVAHPMLYATFSLWLLSELIEDFPQVSNQSKPGLVLFFDEAHLLFEGAPETLIEKVEQAFSRLRSKGVGVYLITQSPLGIPPEIHQQLNNRVQHALRAFTPRDKKAVQTTARTMRQNPSFNAEKTITELGVGEALVSMIEQDGTPAIVERTLICPPVSRIGPASAPERDQINIDSPFAGRYDATIDRESAHKKFEQRAARMLIDIKAPENKSEEALTDGHEPRSMTKVLAKSVARSIGSQVGRPISRGILGGLFGGERRQ